MVDSISPHRRHLALAASVSALAGLLFGYDNIVISGAIRYLGLCFHLDAAGLGWAAGCALIGCVAGAASAGAIADRLGEKKGLALCALCFGLSSVGVCFAGSLSGFVAWRMVAGLGIGAASIIAPKYIAEIAPARYRGRLVTLYQLGIVTGILGAVFINMLIRGLGDEAWNTQAGWRWMFLAGLAPALLFGLTIIPAVESPRWLMKTGRSEDALRALAMVNDPEAAAREAAEIQAALELEEGRLTELITTFRRPLLIGIVLAGFSQASGITAVFSFLPEVFRAAGTATSDAFFQSVLVSLVNLIFTLVALRLIDSSGRRRLILAGTLLQCSSFFLVGWCYHTHASGIAVLVFVMTFVAGHAFGNGAACWVIIAEIYPTKVRGRAMSIATTALWIVGYIANQSFPVLQKHLGSDGLFWCYSFAALANFVFVLKFVPETKGRTLEEITEFWSEQRLLASRVHSPS